MPFTNKLAVATVSLGRHKSHVLERKAQAAKDCGFDGIELVYADLHGHAVEHSQTLLQSARQVRDLCASRNLEILSINPFKNYEGNLDKSLEIRLAEAQGWIDIAVALGNAMIQMPSQFLTNSTGDHNIIVPELRALADLAAEKAIRIAYEGVAFAKHNPLWQDALRIVEAVGRPNFGMCLDNFHIHAHVWGDAMLDGGILPRGQEMLTASLAEFVERCPKDKVFYVQVSDAELLSPPLTVDSPLYNGLEIRDPRLAWSRSCRPFPLEGYLPVAEMLRTWLVDWGWDGWVSFESFLREAEVEENGPEVMAARAQQSVKSLSSLLTATKGSTH